MILDQIQLQLIYIVMVQCHVLVHDIVQCHDIVLSISIVDQDFDHWLSTVLQYMDQVLYVPPGMGAAFTAPSLLGIYVMGLIGLRVHDVVHVQCHDIVCTVAPVLNLKAYNVMY